MLHLQALYPYLILLGASVLVVVLCRSLKQPVMLGYLGVGMLLGPHSLGWIHSPERLSGLAEFGVVFLMFSIGLEFSLPKLKSMWRVVLGLGSAQVLLFAGLVAGALWAMDQSWQAGVTIGAALAMSSTALVMKSLSERLQLNTAHGRNILGVLLLQDLAVVPCLILLPALNQSQGAMGVILLVGLLKAVAALLLLLVFGQKLVRPWFHLVAKQHSSELFMLNVLLFTLSMAALTALAELSLALGAFLAGMLIAETEYRFQVEEDIKPFRDLLLGLFFITLGMRLDWVAIYHSLGWVLALVALVTLGKGLLIAGIARAMRHSPGVSTRIAMSLAQGGEFSLVILTTAGAAHLPAPLAQAALAAVVLSMLITPWVMGSADWVVRRFCGSEWLGASLHLHQIALSTMSADRHVILCGYGRTGQTLARFFEHESIPFFALDFDPERVQQASEAGETVVFGDAARKEVLIAAGLMRARALIITYADTTSALKILNHTRTLRPDLPVVVRTQDDQDIDRLRAAGAVEVVAEIMEGSLMLASHALMLLGLPLNQVVRRIRKARDDRYSLLRGFFHGQSDEEEHDHSDAPRLQVVHITQGASAVGQTLAEIQLSEILVEVRSLQRRNIRGTAPQPDTVLQQGDVLVLAGRPDDLQLAQKRLLG